MALKVKIVNFGPETGSPRKLTVQWSFDPPKSSDGKKHAAKYYNIHWNYWAGDYLSNGEPQWKKLQYENINPPECQSTCIVSDTNIKSVYVTILPVSETYTVKTASGSYEQSYWTAQWSDHCVHNFVNYPDTLSAPNVTLEDYLLTASLDGLDTDVKSVEFEVYKDETVLFNSGRAIVTTTTRHVDYSCNVDAGSKYKVRCRWCLYDQAPALDFAYMHGEWSDWSSSVSTMPASSSGFTKCVAKTATSVYLEWDAVNTATSYDIEYTTKIDYFDSSDKTQTITGIESTRYEKTGLEDGDTYFFRLRAVNSEGKSAWSQPSSVTVGKAPSAPTTWSSTTTVIVGEPLIFYWVHNSEDGSSQTKAELEVTVNNSVRTYTVTNSTEEDEKDKTSSYTFSTSGYQEGGKILWRVRTAGVTGVYGDWSVQRTVDIYAPPTVTLSVTDASGKTFTVLNSFPIRIKATAGPTSQSAIGYHLTITANGTYKTVDAIGNTQYVNKGDTLYSRYFDNASTLSTTLSAGDVSLDNNASYTVTCAVSMNSGLSAESSMSFVVGWSAEEDYNLDCGIGIDSINYAAAINPYCTNASGEIVNDVTLAVYRREYNGKLTEIISGVKNTGNMFVSDPHPALDYARYRIVATYKTTGRVIYYDTPAQPVGGKAAVIQWDETWVDFDASPEDTLASPVWSGSMLQLPYNIDVSDSNSRDVELVEYIGREHPITYYGTQLGITQTWKTDVPKTDIETIYALRRLQNWMGDVYVREPSGSGYWANVDVSFNINHKAVVVPVSITIKRVEGGI